MDHRVQIERLGSRPADSGVRSLVPARERLIVALDVPALHDAVRLVDALASSVTWFKVGSELFTAAGPQAVAAVRERGKRVFLDLKFHDIPRTVASALETAAIKAACGREFVVVTPGIRPAGAPSGDQRRITTPADAVQAGADFLVVGRPVLGAADPVAVVARMVQEMEAAIGKS